MFEVAFINGDDDRVFHDKLGDQSAHPETFLIETGVTIPSVSFV
jgi:hypothetical protein